MMAVVVVVVVVVVGGGGGGGGEQLLYRMTGKECNLEHLSMFLVKYDML